jgi:hypothetical protein
LESRRERLLHFVVTIAGKRQELGASQKPRAWAWDPPSRSEPPVSENNILRLCVDLPPEATKRLEANLSTEDAAGEQMMDRLSCLGVKCAGLTVAETVTLTPIRGPTSVLDYEPEKKIVLT